MESIGITYLNKASFIRCDFEAKITFQNESDGES